MRFFVQLFIVTLIVLFIEAKTDPKEVPLNALIPNRFFNKLSNGWQLSLKALKVKDLLALTKIHARRDEMTSHEAIESVIEEESPTLHRVLTKTGEALKQKHEDNMNKLSDETKNFGQYVFKASTNFAGNMIGKYNQQSNTVKNDIKNVYPHTDHLIQVLSEKLEANLNGRKKRSADMVEYGSQFFTMLLTAFA